MTYHEEVAGEIRAHAARRQITNPQIGAALGQSPMNTSRRMRGLTPFTLHSLRHRFATQLYLATRDLLLVQNLLGHASPTTTQVYTDFDRGASNAAVAHLSMPEFVSV